MILYLRTSDSWSWFRSWTAVKDQVLDQVLGRRGFFDRLAVINLNILKPSDTLLALLKLPLFLLLLLLLLLLIDLLMLLPLLLLC